MKKTGKRKTTNKKKYDRPGQPTKYSPRVIDQLEVYLSQCGREQTALPTVEGFSLFLDVEDDTLVEWGKKYPEFSASLKKLMKVQKQQLVNDGIYGGKEVNSTIVKLILQNNHGMREKVDNTTDDKPISYQIVSFQNTVNDQ